MTRKPDPDAPAVALPYEQSAEGIDRAAALAASTMDHFMVAVDVACLDSTIAATLLVAELLAMLQVHAGVEPEALLERFRHLIDQRAEALRDADDMADAFKAHSAPWTIN